MKHSLDLRWTFGVRVLHCNLHKLIEHTHTLNEMSKNALTLKTCPFVFERYNITTGQYPFEGDNIYRLLENIGKNQWKAPEWFQQFDANLATLIVGMLQSDSQNRLTLKQVKQHT